MRRRWPTVSDETVAKPASLRPLPGDAPDRERAPGKLPRLGDATPARSTSLFASSTTGAALTFAPAAITRARANREPPAPRLVQRVIRLPRPERRCRIHLSEYAARPQAASPLTTTFTRLPGHAAASTSACSSTGPGRDRSRPSASDRRDECAVDPPRRRADRRWASMQARRPRRAGRLPEAASSSAGCRVRCAMPTAWRRG